MSGFLLKILVRLGKCEKGLIEKELDITHTKIGLERLEKNFKSKCLEIEELKSKLEHQEGATSSSVSTTSDVDHLKREVLLLKCKLSEYERTSWKQNEKNESYEDLIKGVEGLRRRINRDSSKFYENNELSLDDIFYIRSIDRYNSSKWSYKKIISLQNDSHLFIWTVDLTQWQDGQQESPRFLCHNNGGFHWRLILYEDMTLHLAPAKVWGPEVRSIKFKVNVELVSEKNNKRRMVCGRTVQCLSIGGILLCDLDVYDPELFQVNESFTIYYTWKCGHPLVDSSSDTETTVTACTTTQEL